MGERRVTRALQGEDADLRAVAVADHQLVIASQGRQGRYRICNVRLSAFQEGVAAQRGDDSHGWPIVATMVALMVCSLFSAWSNTMDAADSKTSSVTSRASMPRRS